ncbi:MAG: glycosyltransferase [Bacteroidaceae bacterium]|nr:glycosyltransferase [Bacteroidaceae bacterium]
MNDTLLYITAHLPHVAAAILLLCLLAYMLIRFPVYRLRGKHFLYLPTEMGGEEFLSVVVVATGDDQALQQHLEWFATQSYAHYEVVVVYDVARLDVAEVVGIMENKYGHVRHTFMPESVQGVSKQKLAFTLGIRSAKSQWVVLLTSDNVPAGRDWLSYMAKAVSDDYDMVLSYSNYENDGSLDASRWTLDRILRQLRYFHAAASRSKGRAVGGFLSGMMLRKQAFTDGRGFASGLHQHGGEDLLLADGLAREGRTTVLLHPEATIAVQLPQYVGDWEKQRLQSLRSTRYLSRRAKNERLRWGVSTACMYLALLLTVGLLVWYVMVSAYLLSFGLAGLSVLVWLVDQYLFSRTTEKLGEGSFFLLYPAYNLTQPLYNLAYRIRSRFGRRAVQI